MCNAVEKPVKYGWGGVAVRLGCFSEVLFCVSLSSQIRIRDPNQGGRDITEEIMAGGSGSRNSTPPVGRPSSTPTPPQVLLSWTTHPPLAYNSYSWGSEALRAPDCTECSFSWGEERHLMLLGSSVLQSFLVSTIYVTDRTQPLCLWTSTWPCCALKRNSPLYAQIIPVVHCSGLTVSSFI